MSEHIQAPTDIERIVRDWAVLDAEVRRLRDQRRAHWVIFKSLTMREQCDNMGEPDHPDYHAANAITDQLKVIAPKRAGLLARLRRAGINMSRYNDDGSPKEAK